MRKSSAFTIVELVIVITVVAILSSLAIVTFNSIREDSRDAARQGNATVISEALEKYYEQNGEYPSVASIANNQSGNTGEAVASKLSVPITSLTMPNMPSTTTNAIAPGADPQNDYLAYEASSAENNASCQNDINGGCDTYRLRYLEEGTGEVKEIASRHTWRSTSSVPELSVSATGPTSITAAWTEMPTASSYTLQRSLSSDMSSPVSTTHSSTSATITGLSVDTEYFFVVRATTPGGETGWSEVESATTSSISPPIGTITIAAAMSGTNARGTAGGGSCAAGTTLERQIRYRVNSGSWSTYTTGSLRDVPATEGYMYTFQAQARCVSGSTGGTWVLSSTAAVTRGVTAPSGLTITAAMSGTIARGTAGGGVCAAGTTIERQIRYQVNGGTWQAYATAAAYRDVAATSGYRYTFQQQARCVGTNTSSGWVASGTAFVDRTVAAPSGLSIAASIVSTSWARGSAGGGSCPAGTSIERQIRYSGRSDTAVSYVAWSTRSLWDVAANEGWRYVFQQQARCVGIYASSGWVASGTNSTVRPIQTSPTRLYVTNSTSGSYTTFTASPNVACPTGSTMWYRYRSFVVVGTAYPTSWTYGHPDYGNPPHNWNLPGSTSNTMTWYTATRNRTYWMHWDAYCRSAHTDGPWMSVPGATPQETGESVYYRP